MTAQQTLHLPEDGRRCCFGAKLLHFVADLEPSRTVDIVTISQSRIMLLAAICGG